MINYLLSIIVLPLLIYYYQKYLNDNEKRYYYGKALIYFHSFHMTSKSNDFQKRMNFNFYELQPSHFCYKSDLNKLLHPDIVLQDMRTLCYY